MKKYETIFILDESKLQDNGEAFIQGVSKLLESLGGTLLEKDFMGKKTFAAPIKKKKAGNYWDLTINLDADQVLPFQEKYRLDEQVLRMAVYIYDRPENPVTLSSSN